MSLFGSWWDRERIVTPHRSSVARGHAVLALKEALGKGQEAGVKQTATRFLIVASLGRNQSDRVSRIWGRAVLVVVHLVLLRRAAVQWLGVWKPETGGSRGDKD